MARVWSEEEFVAEVYKVAPIVYRGRSWLGSKYSEDDFVQDAAVFMLEKFRDKYFDVTRDDLKPIIYRLLNGYFSLNKIKLKKRDRSTFSLNDIEKGLSGVHAEKEKIDFIYDKDLNAEEEINYNESVNSGKELLLGIIDTLEFQPFRSRKHTYKGRVGKKTIELTEANLARLVSSGYKLHDILKVYGYNVTNAGSTSQTTFIAHKVKNIIEKLANKVNELTITERRDVETFLKHSNSKYNTKSNYIEKIGKYNNLLS